VSCVQSIRILSPSEVSQIAQDELVILDTAPIQLTAANSEEIQ
jgi:hypothetical protein